MRFHTARALLSLVVVVLGMPAAFASSDTCDRSDGVPWGTLVATRSYHPPQSRDDARTLEHPSWFFVPLAARVLTGQSGPHLATLSWRGADGAVGACAYLGTGTRIDTTTCTGNGDEYRLTVCTVIDSSGIRFFGGEGLIQGATVIRFHLWDGDSCAPTTAAVDLTTPPDTDGDGTPDCVETPPNDTTPPTWPAGSALHAAVSGATVALAWTAAVDNVAVTRYRIYEDGEVVEEVDGATVSALIVGASPNVAHSFQVQAVDGAGNASTDGPTASAIIDTLPPSWSPNAELSIVPQGLSDATVSWPEATDATGVVAYRVFEDDTLVATVESLSYHAANLDPSRTYVFRVEAVDAAGNESVDGPTATFRIDVDAPIWPPGSALAASISGSAAMFMWTAATDNVGVAGYRLYQDGALVAEVGPSSLTANITALAPEVTYTFQVQAFDAAGNASTDGPTVQLRIDGLAPTWPLGSALAAVASGPGAATLVWTAATDNVGVAGYRLYQDGALVAAVGPATLTANIAGLAPEVTYTFQVQAFDAAGNASTDGPMSQLRLDGLAPTWPAGSAVIAQPTGARSARLGWTVAIDNVGVAAYWVVQNGLVVQTVAATTLGTDVTGLDPEATYTFRIQAADAAGNLSTGGPSTTLRIGTPDPALVAPSLDATVSTTVFDDTAFLYTGPDPIQRGVAPGTIRRENTVLLRGMVTDLDGAPLRDVEVAVLGHPEFGGTHTREDGLFDLVVNGPGSVVVTYALPPRLPAQRRIDAPWTGSAWLPDVVLIEPDPQVTEIEVDSPAAQIARGTEVTDQDGVRQATLVIPPSTSATMTLPDGTTAPALTMHVRATEYTVGASGPHAMPGALPPTSAYTYAVELSLDEAAEAGATRVAFNQPLAFYVDNFLGFPVGETVPVGYYDGAAGSWVESTSGVILKVVGQTGGVADIDADGDGAADTPAELAALGITVAERAELALLYPAGKSLWRFPVTHFTAWDANWGFSPPDDATSPDLVVARRQLKKKPCRRAGSIVECENQVLGEDIGLTGTGLRLHYQSERAAGHNDRALDIKLSGPTLPASLRRIHLVVQVAGQRHEELLPPQTNLSRYFLWDGKDAYGRQLQGATNATIYLGYVYGPVYRETERFGYAGNGIPLTANRAAAEFELYKTETVYLSKYRSAPEAGLGGWTVSTHHDLDLHKGVLYRGDGVRQEVGNRTRKLADVPTAGSSQLAVAKDGSAYIAQPARILRVAPDGTVSTYAGVGSGGFGGDGGPATQAQFDGIAGLAIADDGTMYVLDGGNRRIRKIAPNGLVTTLTTIADVGKGMALGPDGTLYYAEPYRIARIHLPTADDPTVRTEIVGGSFCFSLFCYDGDGGPATQAHLSTGGGLAVGRDGTVYIGSPYTHTVRAISTSGTIYAVAGNKQIGITGDGGSALDAAVWPIDVAVGPDNSVYLGEYGFNGNSLFLGVVRRIDSQGRLNRVLGSGTCSSSVDGTTGLGTNLCDPVAITVASDGNLWVADFDRLIRLESGLPSLAASSYSVPSLDGTEVYVFDRSGRHLRTVDSVTGVTKLSFGYAGSALASVDDGLGNVVALERVLPGHVTLVAPFGQRTDLTFDANGYLASVTDPIGESVTLTYQDGGLLTSMSHPLTGTSSFTYDGDGALVTDTAPGGGFQRYSYAQTGDTATVTRTTRQGVVETFQTSPLPNGGEQRVLSSAGLVSTEQADLGGTKTVTYPDGTRVNVTTAPDPRFGMDAPMATGLVTTTPGGRSVTTKLAQAVSLTQHGDPLSLSSLTVSSTLNGARTWTSTYDGGAHTIASRTPAGRQSSAALDARGRVVQMNLPGRLPTTVAYDGRGRATQVQQGARVVTYEYDNAGYVAHVTGPHGRDVRTTYDAIGRPLTMTRPDGRQVLLAYEAAGRRQLVSPPGRPAHASEVNPEGRTGAYQPPDVGTASGRLTQFDYDGRVLSITHGNGDTLGVERDAAGRPVRVTTPRGKFTYAYDAATGHLTSAHTPEGQSETYAYDGPLLLGVTVAGTTSGSVAFGYDGDLRLALETVDGQSIGFAYDNDNGLTLAGALIVHRDAASGDVTGTTLGNLVTHEAVSGYGEIDHRDAALGQTALYASDVLARDPTGRVLSRRDSVLGEIHVYDHIYDAVGRLTDVILDGSSASHYDYDDNGNRLSRDADAGTEAYTYDAQDRLLSAGGALYTYTADGALDTKVVGDAATEYRYDMGGALLGVTLPSGDEIGYLVDTSGRRVDRTKNGVVTHGWLYGANLGPAVELDASGQVVSRFVYGTRSWVPAYLVKGGVTYSLITDAVGSVRLVVDVQTGAVVQRLDYDEFGRVLLDTHPGFQPFGFGGGLYDPDTGLVRLGARDYDPEVGRWTSKDPLLFGGGDTNVYAYAGNDPVNHIDPTGLIDEGDIADASAGVGDAALRWLTFGRLNPGPALRRLLGIDDIVNPCSRTYAMAGAITDIALAIVAARVAVATEAEALPDLAEEAQAAGGTGLRTAEEAGISPGAAERIQNAADRTGQQITVVGSRASGTAGPVSDWDYILSGNSGQRHSASSSLPRGTSGGVQTAGGNQTGIDVWQTYNPSAPGYTTLDPTRPHVIFRPR